MNLHARIGEENRAERDPRPGVVLPRAGLPKAALLAGAVFLALATFLLLAGKTSDTSDGLQGEDRQVTIASPAPLQLPAFQPNRQLPDRYLAAPYGAPLAPSGSAPQSEMYRERPSQPGNRALDAPPPSPQTDWPSLPTPAEMLPPADLATAQPARRAPAIAYDRGGTTVWFEGSAGVQREIQGRADSASISRPLAAGDPSSTIPTGTIISAVLETPIDTAQSGLARAVISKAVRSYDGTRVLIPRGSKLLGTVDGSGAARVMVKWSELALPDGTIFLIDSPAASADGRTGIPGKTRGGVGRFLGGVLQTALSVGTGLAIGGRRATVIGIPAAATAVTGISPQQPRITVASGTRISVVTAKAIDFSPAPEG